MKITRARKNELLAMIGADPSIGFGFGDLEKCLAKFTVVA